MADLRVNFCGVELKNPVTTASGTFGFGHEYANFYDLGELGGVGAKGLTPEEQLGNPAPRIAETPMGILNCVGLQIRALTALFRRKSRICVSSTPKLSPMSPVTALKNTWASWKRSRMQTLI